MATSTTVLGSSGTSTQLSDTAQNPTTSANRQIIHLTLVCDGSVAVTAASLYAALDAQYGTVQMEKATAARGAYIFNLST